MNSALKQLGLAAASAGAVMLLSACGSSPTAGSGAGASGQQPPAIDGYVLAPGGPFLTDSAGRRLQFHGINIVYKCESTSVASTATGSPCLPSPPGAAATGPNYYLALDTSEADPERRITESEVAALAGMGLNSARVGIIWAALEPGPAGVQPNDPRYCTAHTDGTPFAALAPADEPFNQATIDAYLSHIDGLVAMLARHGIRSLIDMHQDDYSAAFYNPNGTTPWKAEGAPLWAVCTSPISTASPLPPSTTAAWGTAALVDLRIPIAIDHFWANDVSGNLQGEYIRAFAAVAAHYRGNPAVIGYDLFNEPFDITSPTPLLDFKLQCFYAGSNYSPISCLAVVPPQQGPAIGLIPTLQQADPEHLEFYEPDSIANEGLPNTIAVPEPLPFSNLVDSFHVYPQPADNATAEQLVFTEEQLSRDLMQTAQPGGPPWFMTEFGAENDPSDLANYGKLADSMFLSWMYWSAKQFHDPTGNPDEAMLDANGMPTEIAPMLTRTYPLATAGTPTAQSFDPDSAIFQFSYTPDPAVTAPTQIFVPVSQHYAKGYKVTVSGATVTSAAGAALLTLQNQVGAATVAVTVAPVP